MHRANLQAINTRIQTRAIEGYVAALLIDKVPSMLTLDYTLPPALRIQHLHINTSQINQSFSQRRTKHYVSSSSQMQHHGLPQHTNSQQFNRDTLQSEFHSNRTIYDVMFTSAGAVKLLPTFDLYDEIAHTIARKLISAYNMSIGYIITDQYLLHTIIQSALEQTIFTKLICHDAICHNSAYCQRHAVQRRSLKNISTCQMQPKANTLPFNNQRCVWENCLIPFICTKYLIIYWYPEIGAIVNVQCGMYKLTTKDPIIT